MLMSHDGSEIYHGHSEVMRFELTADAPIMSCLQLLCSITMFATKL